MFLQFLVDPMQAEGLLTRQLVELGAGGVFCNRAEQ